MNTTRREFLRLGSAAAAGTLLGAAGRLVAQVPGSQPATRPVAPAEQKLRILILGGTGFLGPHVVEAAQQRGHTLTLFNRGKTNPQLFPDLEKLHGNRYPDKDEGLRALAGRKWDAVVDTSAYVPRIARASAELLKDSIRQYVLISTISVYADTSKPGMDETAPLGQIADPTIEKVDGETYGPLKALCEQAVEQTLPDRAAIVRPGLIVGPGDPSDRFTYWPARVTRGGEVLAPGTPADPVQYIDVRDLAEWLIRMIETNTNGSYNAVGPQDELGMGKLLETCKQVSGSNATFTWADADFLASQQVTPWGDMPVWVPPRGDSAGFARVSRARAMARGLTFRPLETTVRATLAWHQGRPPERQAKLRAGLTPEREAQVLAAWHLAEKK